MKAARLGITVVACSLARAGSMHSSIGRPMQPPMARSACRRSIRHDWVRMFAIWFDSWCEPRVGLLRPRRNTAVNVCG